jgi:hypothetical protein
MIKKILLTLSIAMLTTLFTINVQLAQATQQEQPWSKYPNNAEKKFKDVNEYYTSLNREQYTEFENAKLNIREKVFFKDINKVMARADKYGSGSVSGAGYHPKRQVYVFVSVSPGGLSKHAVFDAETGIKISGAQ